MRFFIVSCLVGCTLWLTLDVSADAAERRSRRSRRSATADARVVEFFEAEKAGDIEIKFIPKDATMGNVLIKNKTDKPLSVKLPDTFGTIHAQFGGGGMGGGGMGGGGGGGGGQSGGGGMGGGGMGGGMGGGGGGMFSVAPEKVGKIKVATVCLEHGKKDPNPRMKYKIVPLEQVTKDPKVLQVCKMLGDNEIPQNSAQAAAWHLANGLSWQQLAVKNRVELRTVGYAERWFNPRELRLALRITSEAERRAGDTPVRSPGEEPYSPGEQNSQAGG